MADTTNLPEGTDTIIGGAGEGGSSGGTGRSGTSGNAATTSTQTNSTGGQTSTTASSDATDALITGNGANAGSSSSSALGGGSAGGIDDSGSGRSGMRGLISNAGGKLRDEGKTRARGLVSQGLERGSTTLTNISSLVDDTVSQIEERLGPQYGGYARSASQTLNRYATSLQNKDPEELVEDARQLVRKSPAVALTGAAILGFGLVRLLKAGIEEGSNGNGNRDGDRTGSAG